MQKRRKRHARTLTRAFPPHIPTGQNRTPSPTTNPAVSPEASPAVETSSQPQTQEHNTVSSIKVPDSMVV